MPDTTVDIDATLRRLRADFSDIVAQFVRDQVDVLTGISPDLLPLLDTLEDLLDGGRNCDPPSRTGVGEAPAAHRKDPSCPRPPHSSSCRPAP